MPESIPSQELYYLVPVHEVLTPKEAISILQYTVEILKEKINSLLMFDIVQADLPNSDELNKEIKKDGVVNLRGPTSPLKS